MLIVGSGPAGLFCADQLRQAGVDGVLIVEKGKPMAARVCPESPWCDCRLCDVLEGEGGAGGFSDGKITLSPTRGTHAQRLFSPEQEELLSEVERVITTYFPDGVRYAPVRSLTPLEDRLDAPLRFESYPLVHVGSDGIRQFAQRYSTFLGEQGITILTGVEARELLLTRGRAAGAVLADRNQRQEWTIHAGAVCVATGLMGTAWLERQLAGLGVHLETGPADIGIRLETRFEALDPFISEFYDFKIDHISPAGLAVRSFCVNGNGFVVNEYHRPIGIRGVNGHSFLARKSGLSNLAILATVDQRLADDPKTYVREVARRVNQGAHGYPVRQELGEFLPEGSAVASLGITPSNPKTRPGPLGELLPTVLHEAFCSYVRALGSVLPPLLAADSVIYAPEIKYYNHRIPVDPHTWRSADIDQLWVIGNAAGYTASLSAAALTGIIAGRAIAAHTPTSS